MTQFRRMICMLLTLVMIVSLVPLAVTAEDIPETYTVQFNLNYSGAPKIPDQTVAAGECIREPQNVTRTGWIFQYWYVKTENGIKRFDPTESITEDLSLYARWKENTSYWGPIWDASLRNVSQNKPTDETIEIIFDQADHTTTTDLTPVFSGKLSTMQNVVEVTWMVTAAQNGELYSKTGHVVWDGDKWSFEAPLVYGENSVTVIVRTEDGKTYEKTLTIECEEPQDEDPTVGYFTVTGRLVSAADGTPAPYTNVSLSSSKHLYKDRTDKDGYFTFEDVEKFGSYTLTAGDIAYYEYYLDNSVSIQTDTNLGNIALTPVPFEDYWGSELRVRFIDSETGEVIPLQDVFGDIRDSEDVNFFICDDTQPPRYDDQSSYSVGCYLDLDTDEVYFSGLKESDTYYLFLHQFFLLYNEPDEIQQGGWKHDEDYSYISVSGLTQVTYTLTKREEQLSYLDYDPLLWVCGERVTSENAADILGDGTVSYDIDTKTLTLNNAKLEVKTPEKPSDPDYMYLYDQLERTAITSYIDGLNIVIPEGTTTEIYYADMDGYSRCIDLYDDCSFTGGGTIKFAGVDEKFVIGIDRWARQLYIANVSMEFGANMDYGIRDMYGGEDPAIILLHNANLYTSEDKHDFFSSIIQNGCLGYHHCMGVTAICENTTIKTWHDDWERCINARGDVYIKDSTIHMTAENMGFGGVSMMLYGECSTVQITGNSSISLVSDNTDTTEDHCLLAAEELIIDSTLVITNENGEVCQIVNENDIDTIRSADGKYPTSVFVKPVA